MARMKVRRRLGLLFITLATTALVLAMSSSEAGACDRVGYPTEFVGTVDAIEGSLVRFDVKAPSGSAVSTEVDFGSDAARLHVGSDYRVRAIEEDRGLRSRIEKPRAICPGDGTVNADGSIIDNAVMRDQLRVFAIAAIAMVGLGWYRRRLVINNSPEAERVARSGLAGLGV